MRGDLKFLGRWARQLAACGLIGWATLSGGCAKQEAAPASPESNATETETENQTAQQDLGQQLVGVWLGQAQVDPVRLQEKLQSTDEAERAALQRTVQNFLTTVIAIQYTADGQVEHDIEMTVDGGPPLRESSIGKWKVVGQSGRQVEIEVVEQLSDGSTAETRKRVTVGPEGNRIELEAPIGIDGIGARLVLERQPVEVITAQDPDAEVAR